MIFYNFPIDDRKKFFRRNKANKHTRRIDRIMNARIWKFGQQKPLEKMHKKRKKNKSGKLS